MRVLGTDELNAYLKKYDLVLEPAYNGVIGQHSKKPLKRFVTGEAFLMDWSGLGLRPSWIGLILVFVSCETYLVLMGILCRHKQASCHRRCC